MLARCSERQRDIPLVCEIMGLKYKGFCEVLGSKKSYGKDGTREMNLLGQLSPLIYLTHLANQIL